MKVIMVMIEKSPKDPCIAYVDKYKVFEHSEKGYERAMKFAKENGYEESWLNITDGFKLDSEVGMLSMFAYADVCVKIMNQEIE